MKKPTQLLAVLLAVVASSAGAQTYPDRAVRIIIPVGPGGGFDFLARIVAPKLSERLGQPVVAENRPGAGSLIGTEAVAKAPHDGYTLLVGGASNMAANSGIYKNLSYDPVADFKPVSISMSLAVCLLARKDLPQASLKELIDFARANPGKVTYASAGAGSLQHIAGALLAHLNGAQMLHIPYKGASAAQTDQLAGRVDLLFGVCSVKKQFVDSGQLKVLAVASASRAAEFANVPTVAETGVAPLEIDSWFGFFVGARTPQPIVDRLRSELTAIIASPEVAERLTRDGGRLLRMSPRESEAFVQAEVTKYRTLLPKAGVTAD